MAIDITDLLAAPRETLGIEHKSWLDLTDQHHRGVLAKAIIALANHGGGYVILGITEDGADRYPTVRPECVSKYTSEVIAGVVKKFVDPVFECLLDYVPHPATGIEVAVVTVPGGIPDIVLSKSGIADGPITEFRPYIRKPGAASEMPTTIAEWRGLFDRCVKARQNEMLGAIRAIVMGMPEQAEGNLADDLRAQEDFTTAALARWNTLIERTPPNSSARFPLGHWSANFSLVGDFEKPTLRELMARLSQAEDIKHSG